VPRPRSDDEVEQIETQLAGLNKRLEEAKARSKARKAAEDHRRWLLAGQVAVQQMQAAPSGEFFKTIMGLLDNHARSAADRALFGLLPLKGSNGDGGDGSSQTP